MLRRLAAERAVLLTVAGHPASSRKTVYFPRATVQPPPRAWMAGRRRPAMPVAERAGRRAAQAPMQQGTQAHHVRPDPVRSTRQRRARRPGSPVGKPAGLSPATYSTGNQRPTSPRPPLVPGLRRSVVMSGSSEADPEGGQGSVGVAGV